MRVGCGFFFLWAVTGDDGELELVTLFASGVNDERHNPFSPELLQDRRHVADGAFPDQNRHTLALRAVLLRPRLKERQPGLLALFFEARE